MIGSIVAIAIGTILGVVIGPAIVFMGMSTPRTSGDHDWAFFEAYSWCYQVLPQLLMHAWICISGSLDCMYDSILKFLH